jgi:hypothetical protein
MTAELLTEEFAIAEIDVDRALAACGAETLMDASARGQTGTQGKYVLEVRSTSSGRSFRGSKRTAPRPVQTAI